MTVQNQRVIGLLFVFVAAFGFYLRSAAPAVTAGDSGEFMTAGATLSLPHAPSFPVFTLTSRVWTQLVPWGALPYRMNIFSAFLGALSVAGLFLLFASMGLSGWTAAIVAVGTGMTMSFWINSLVTEVFALNTFFVVALLLVLSRMDTHPVCIFLYSFILGWGVGNHQVLIVMAVPLALRLIFSTSSVAGPRAMIQARLGLFATLFFLIGFSVYTFLPIRSVKNPPLNWGQPTTWKRFVRTLTRADYGTLKLAIGESPKRNVINTARQMRRFAVQLSREMSWPLLVLGGIGLLYGLTRERKFYRDVMILFVFSGPLFFLLSNLPFQAQSEGIMGRFFIMPALFLALGWGEVLRRLPQKLALVSLGVPLLLGVRGYAEASAHRNTRLVWDYGHAIFRTLPPRSILFMDGGDDAFYSLAALHYGMKKRPDLDLHDRGGLVYRNIYGADFRRLNRDDKTRRRRQVESSFLGARPVFYSTMDDKVLPDAPLFQRGFLFEASSNDQGGVAWAHLTLRSLYPPDLSDYRTRALAAFFPYMKGRKMIKKGDVRTGLSYFRRASIMAPDVDWLQINLSHDYAQLGYDHLTHGRLSLAETIYADWLHLDSTNFQAHSNLGVVYEKLGHRDRAVEQYELTSRRFPEQPDPVYNLAVLYWGEKNWPLVKSHLEEALRRDPRHAAAQTLLQRLRIQL